MFGWFFNLFKRKMVEVKPEEYKTSHEIGGVKFLVPRKDWQPAIKYNEKGEPVIIYLKKAKIDDSGLPKDKR